MKLIQIKLGPNDDHLLLVVQARVSMFVWVGVKVFHYVVTFSFQQMVVVILNKEVLDLESTDPSLIVPVDSTVCSVWLEGCQLSE